jgi:DNA-binding Lrp family transcriptional regulator
VPRRGSRHEFSCTYIKADKEIISGTRAKTKAFKSLKCSIEIVRKVIVLINTSLGSDKQVADELRQIEGVKEVYKVRGVYDILAKIEAPDPERVKEIISSKLLKIADIRSTITMIVTNDGISALA